MGRWKFDRHTSRKGHGVLSDNASRRDAALKNLEKELKSRSRREKMRPLGVTMATLVVLIVLVGGIYLLATSGGNDEENLAEDTAAPTETETETSGPYTGTGDAAKEVSLPDGENIPEDGTTDVTLNTNKGEIGLTLDHAQAPIAANSFEHLVNEAFYDDTTCHRVVNNDGMKILQCGDPSGDGSGGPGYNFPDEYPVNDEEAGEGLYKRGVLAMANSGENTNGSQFFLVDDESQLPNDYTIFGTISEDGLETLDSIIEENADANQESGGDGAPTEEVKIETASVDE
ncbi:MAG TPA: peptidylprolyl isomerase [Candidatus Corynebacterium avicola]|uniref:Peptidylprolyl isomerase n=1 Tax=Candidatus Corynebacterium avicola TaxID=2838527 RepID=A0A9D1RP90_9CORY|nr:peptidylprolyl isomerase [Candidatus Corynebacterium avicola]